MTNVENNSQDAQFMGATAAPKGGGKPRDFVVVSIAAVEAIRHDNGWSMARLCRVSGFDRRQYRRIRDGALPLTPEALSRLTAGLRILAADPVAHQPPVPRMLEIGSEYHVIADGMRRRREELGLTCEQVDYLTGFTSGHTSKLENWRVSNGRGFGETSCRLWCDALGVSLAVVEGVVPVATMRMASPIGSAELSRRFDANQRRLEALRRTLDAKRAGRTA